MQINLGPMLKWSLGAVLNCTAAGAMHGTPWVWLFYALTALCFVGIVRESGI
jgi:hypothetical protein